MTRLWTARPAALRVMLIVFCLALWLPGFFTIPPMDRDESRFAQATKQMIETGDFVNIRYANVPRNTKPIGIYWLQAPFAMAARGVGLAAENPIWPYRLPSLLGALVAVLATFELGLTLCGNRRAAAAAAAMLAASVILVTEAHTAKTDAALLGATTLAMAVLARAWAGAGVSRRLAAFFWLAAGAGILIKGPITPLVLGLCAVGASLQARRWRWLLALRPGWGVPLMLAVVLPWFIAIGLATHGQFFRQAVGNDLGNKLAGGSESHGGFFGLHLLLLPLLSFPSSLVLLRALPSAWANRRDSTTQFLLAWVVPAWLVFEIVPTKLPHYTLPLYPGLFLLTALWMFDARRLAPARFLRWASSGGFWVAGTVLGLGAAALPLALDATWWLGLPGLAAAALCLGIAWRARTALRPAHAHAWALAAMLPLYAAILGLELPRIPALWLGPRVMEALRANWVGFRADGAMLAEAGYAEPSLRFLAGTHMRLLEEGVYGVGVFARAHATCLIVSQEEVPKFEEVLGKKYGMTLHELARVSGYNYARGRNVTLVLMAPDGSVNELVPQVGDRP